MNTSPLDHDTERWLLEEYRKRLPIRATPLNKAQGELSKKGAVPLEGGTRSYFVYKLGDFVYKFTRMDGEDDALTRVLRHNWFFGDITPYEIKGRASDEFDEFLVLVQPYMDFEPNSGCAAQDQMFNCLRSVDPLAQRGSSEICAMGWDFDDVKPANMGVLTGSGEWAVIDCNLNRLSELSPEVRLCG